MMSIQLLYSRQVPRTINCDPDMLGKGLNSITLDDVLCILSKVQHEHPVGNAVLNAQIALDKGAKESLINALTNHLVHDEHDKDISKSLAEAAVFEVCETPVCPRCKGTGEIEQKGKGMVECSRCNGIGNFILSDRSLHKMIIRSLSEDKRMSRATFIKKWYDIYMTIVDMLNIESSEAAKYAKSILREIEEQETSLIR